MNSKDRTAAIERSRESSRIWEIARLAVEKYGGAVPAGTVSYNDLDDVPSTFTPASHNNTSHSSTYITAADLPATYAPSTHNQAASTITTATTSFGGELSATDDTVQKALDTLDDHVHPAGTGGGVLYDVQADRPAAGTDGLLFMPTDGYFTQIDNGVTWDVYVDGFKCSSPPLAASLSKINDAAIVLTDEGDGLLFQGNGTGGAGNKYNAAVTAIPGAGAYTFTMGFDTTYLLSGEGVGIGITDGTGANAKLILYMLFNNSTNLVLYVQYVTCPTTFSSTPAQVINIPAYFTAAYYRRLYLRIADDRTTNLVFSYNHQFRLGNWEVAGTLAREAWLTPAYAGAAGMENVTVANGLIARQMKIFHWSLG